MKKDYERPVVEEVPFLVERPICTASAPFGGGDYDLLPDDFDSDSDSTMEERIMKKNIFKKIF